MKVRKKIGDLGKETIQQLVEEFLEELGEGAVALLAYFEGRDNPEYLTVEVDEEEKILGFTAKDGSHYLYNLKSETLDAIEERIVALEDSPSNENFENIEDIEDRLEVKKDAEDKIISYRKEDGTLVESAGIETSGLTFTGDGLSNFKELLKTKIGTDWTDAPIISIPIPRLAFVNISGVYAMPTLKGVDAHAWMEVYDGNGNYFKKRILLNAQGNSSMYLPKKNFAADFCEDEWEGDITTNIIIGNWVAQDSFHFKGYYTSITKGENPCAYKVFDKFMETLPFDERAPYMEYFNGDYSTNNSGSDDIEQNMEFAAKCYPGGFPCIVYLNDEFYGIFAWQNKKHRDNFHMSKSKPAHIHIDGHVKNEDIWGGTVDWTAFEVRNPKNLVYAAAHTKNGSTTFKYDADLAQDEIAGTDTNYDGNWTANAYAVGRVVKHSDNYFINQVAGNTNEPVLSSGGNNNTAKDPDFKNKTGCGWINCTNSVKVKDTINALSNYMSEIAVYEDAYNNASDADKPAALAALKAEIESRFSVSRMIDYVIYINLLQDPDAIMNNAQWTTWGKIDDTVKWYPNPYDNDQSFGVQATMASLFYTPSATERGKTENTPFKYVWTYYLDGIKARYAELRDAKAIDYNTIFGIVKEWVDAIGLTYYVMEAAKWPDTPCNRGGNINNTLWEKGSTNYLTYTPYASNWDEHKIYANKAYCKYGNRCYKSLADNNVNHTPGNSGAQWWEDVTVKAGSYSQGDVVFDGLSNFYCFVAKENLVVTYDSSNTNRPDHLTGAPFTKLYGEYPHENGTYDSIYRISKWIKEKIRVMDTQMGYGN